METGKILDMKLALKLAYHIDNPCIDPITGQNIRAFYIRLAEEQIGEMENPCAIKYLESKIQQYTS